ncbi:hypothetical protein IFM89_005034 [Coptis chinensis]|uniref:Uncharacterized protein n=1 Tax=Coptis chinensis TaxID=261450 RepID=A0A835HJ36_9MAGN|nr:hypothetical protein IFM89_005034 [Coptis chinensis]
MDPRSSVSFDSHYYQALTQKQALFHRRQRLLTGIGLAKLARRLLNGNAFMGNYGVIHQQKSIPIFQTATGKLVEELKSSMMKVLSVLNGNDDHVAHTGPEPRECLPCRKPFDSSPSNTQSQGLRNRIYNMGKNYMQVFPLIKTLTFNIICSLLFGLEHGTRREKLVEWFEEMVEARGPVISLTTFNRSIRASSRIQNMIMDIISEKKLAVEEQVVSPDQKDLITNLLSMHREDNSALRCTTWSPGSHGSYA